MKSERSTRHPGKASNLRAVLFKSRERFSPFREKLAEYGVACTVLDFEGLEWIDYDYSGVDLVIYYPSFEFTSNHPHALGDVYDNLMFLAREFPHISFYPDPGLIRYYNDKYRQYLFLKKHGYPIPETLPLVSDACLNLADETLGYPMVLKNRHGAGGDSVFRVFNRKELARYYNLSGLNLFNLGSLGYFGRMMSRRIFYYHLIRERKAMYPFLSRPVLAQKFIRIDRDLKIVVGDGRVVEGHWRVQADETMWKVNIDGGGIGVWSEIPQSAQELSTRLARDLKARWLNIDMIQSDGRFLITEFSPVWHHYAYREKPSFVYRDDYNIDVPLETSLDLEKIIVESLIRSRGEVSGKGKDDNGPDPGD